jgi:hypothetical protein
MPVKWKNRNRFRPSVVLEEIEKSRTINEDGSVSFKGMWLSQNTAVLSSMLEFPEAAADMDKIDLVRSAVFSARPDLDPDSFIKSINSKLSNFLSRREASYSLLATLSMSVDGWPSVISIGDAKIRFFGRSFPKKYADRQRVISSEAKGLDVTESPSTYCAVGVDVLAKSEGVAARKALRVMDLLRGMLCMNGNAPMQFILSGPDYIPINVVRLGSFHTLHASDGSTIKNNLWYEPEYRQAEIFAFKNIDEVKKEIRFSIGRLTRSKIGGILSDSVVRYARALDEPNPSTAFLRLWGAIEMLLTPGRADYDLLIERCCFLYKDVDYVRQVLMHLRECRNSSVHAGHEGSEDRTNCYILQKYYIHLFRFLVHHSLRYDSLNEVHQFLDSARDVGVLKSRHKILRHAIAFRGK